MQKHILSCSNKYIFISLAVGSDFFDKDDILIIKKIFSNHKFKLINETIIHYTKSKIPYKYFFIKKSSQTHKHILIYKTRIERQVSKFLDRKKKKTMNAGIY